MGSNIPNAQAEINCIFSILNLNFNFKLYYNCLQSVKYDLSNRSLCNLHGSNF